MEKLFQSVKDNIVPQVAEITGEIPDWVEGKLFRLGPAKWDFDDGFSFNHWLDGCSLIYKLTIRKGHVDVMSRFLNSTAYQKLTKINRPVFTEFGTKSYPDPCKNIFSRTWSKLVPLELTDNDIGNIFPIDDDIYVSSETCHLWRISSEDLSCLEKTDLHQLISVHLASSHPHRSEDGTVYNLGASFMTGPQYHIVKLPPPFSQTKGECPKGFRRASVLASVSSPYLKSLSYYHSFGLSEKFAVFVEQPLLINIGKMALSGVKGYALKDCFEWKPEFKTKFHLIDRVSGDALKTKYQSDALFFFHHVNTYEEEGHLITDILAFPDHTVLDKFYLERLRLGEFDTTCQCILTRFVLPLKVDGNKGENLVTLKNTSAKAILQENGTIFLEPETIGEEGYEMPTINYSMVNTKKYRYLYGSGVFETGKFANSLLKMDLCKRETLTWRQSSTTFPGELVFVPRPGATEEDDGVLLTVVLDVAPDTRDFLMVMDAKTFKELGRAYIPRTIQLPPSVHGVFVRD